MKRYVSFLITVAVLLIVSACGSNTVDGKTKEEWLTILQNGNEAERLAAISAVSKFGPEAVEAVPHLIQILETGSEPERLEAVIALGKMGPVASEALTPLLLAMGKEYRIPCLEKRLCGELSTSIAAIAQAKAVPLCQVLFELEDRAGLLFCTTEILPKVGPEAIPGLVEILTTSDHEVSRTSAVVALDFIADNCGFGPNKQLAVEILQKIAGSDPIDKIRNNAQKVLEKVSKCGK